MDATVYEAHSSLTDRLKLDKSGLAFAHADVLSYVDEETVAAARTAFLAQPGNQLRSTFVVWDIRNQ